MWILGIGTNVRSTWFILVTISCIDSITQSDILSACCRKLPQNTPRAREMPADDSLPSVSGNVNIKQETKEEQGGQNLHRP